MDNYRNIILLFENVFMCLITIFFAIIKYILFKIYFKSLVLRFEIVIDKTFSVLQVFYCLDLVASFSNYQNTLMPPPMPLQLQVRALV